MIYAIKIENHLKVIACAACMILQYLNGYDIFIDMQLIENLKKKFNLIRVEHMFFVSIYVFIILSYRPNFYFIY